MNDLKFEGKTINRRWKVLYAIGTGSFGKVFAVYDSELKDYAALKVEESKKDDKLRLESKILMSLNNVHKKKQGLPVMYWFGTDTNFS